MKTKSDLAAMLLCGRLQIAKRRATSTSTSFVEALYGFCVPQCSALFADKVVFHHSTAARQSAAELGIELCCAFRLLLLCSIESRMCSLL